MLEVRSRFDAARERWGLRMPQIPLFHRTRAAIVSVLGLMQRALRRTMRIIEWLDYRYRVLTKGWHRAVVYHDGRVTLDAHQLTLHGYYIPFGRKRIPYVTIRSVDSFALTAGRAYRIHGPGWGRVWYPHDARRPEREEGIIIDIGTMWRPVLTPDEPHAVLRLLEQRLVTADDKGLPLPDE